MNFSCFLLFENSSIAQNFGTTGPIQMGFSATCTSEEQRGTVVKVFDSGVKGPQFNSR